MFSAKRCKCLGSFSSPAQSLAALDDYCRASFNTGYDVMKSGRERDAVTHEYVDLVVPEKSRCGSLDELEIKAENECKCESKNGEGAEDGVILHLDLVNLPFRPTLKDPTTEDFKTAKLIVEKAVRPLIDYNRSKYSINMFFPSWTPCTSTTRP